MGSNRWKLEVARSALWAGCPRTYPIQYLNGVDGEVCHMRACIVV